MANGAELAVPVASESLARPPIYDAMNERKLSLVKDIVGKDIPAHGLGLFLEICAHYDLAWEAKEAWCVNNNGQLMVMVGRDGLRKIAQRNGIKLRGDVVREQDRFIVTHMPDRTVTIEHSYEGGIEARGAIVGAWCEAWEAASGAQRGYFYAPMSEYRPKSAKKLEYSPWGSQESVMILSAAERQAIRQATPLSGLLAQGEMDLNDERSHQELTGAGEAPAVAYPDSVLGHDIEALVARANELEPQSWLPPKVAMEILGRTEEELEAFAERLRAFVRERAPDDPLVIADAEVVERGHDEEAVPEVAWDPEAYERVKHDTLDLEARLDEDLSDEERRRVEREVATANANMAALEAARERQEQIA